MSQARRPLTLMVISDSPVVAAGVSTMLAPYSHRVAIESSRGRSPAAGEVDVLLLDVLGDPDPTSRLSQLVAGPAAAVLVLGGAGSEHRIDSTARDGVARFLGKDADGPAIVAAAEAAVASGSTRVSTETERSTAADGSDGTWPGQDAGLTAREADVLGLVVAGLSNQDVAARLFLSINSVKSYIRSAYRKMGVTSRSQAVLWGLEHGFQVSQTSLWRTESH